MGCAAGGPIDRLSDMTTSTEPPRGAGGAGDAAPATYRAVVADRSGGPDVLRVEHRPLRPPATHEVRIAVLAASVSRPDVTARQGSGLYSGTRLSKARPPYVPGYSVVGDVDAVGSGVSGVAVGDRVGALTVVGGYTEYLHWPGNRLIPVPPALAPDDAVPALLNFIVAYQSLFRRARALPGERALIVGASGGIGTAVLQLGALAGVEMVGLASTAKHATVRSLGATPVDYRSDDVMAELHAAAPDGFDVVVDGMMRPDGIQRGLVLLRRGGRLVTYGEPAGFADLRAVLRMCVACRLRPDGRSCHLYGTSLYSMGVQEPYRRDWATLFRLMEQGRIRPVIDRRLPLDEAAHAHALLEQGAVTGNVVLVTPRLTAA